jgi:kynurenine formamidase
MAARRPPSETDTSVKHPIPPIGLRLVDLSRPLEKSVGIYPGDPGVDIATAATHESHGYAVASLHLGSHAGTHVDAPFHFLAGGATLDAFAPDRFVGEAVVLDVRDAGRRAEISAERLEWALDRVDGLQGARLVLLWTGWDTHFGREEMFDHPHLSPAGAELLVAEGVGLVGTDALNIDPSSGGRYPVHELLLGAEVLIVENLTRLGELGEGRAYCALLPLPLVGTDGAPLRAVAWLRD